MIYFTSEAKPPASGLLSPEPNSPSTTRVPASRWGGSNSCFTSMNCCIFLTETSLSLFAAQSADRCPVMLNKNADTP